MNSVWIIAANTFRETIRNKVLYAILVFAVVIIVLSISFGEWSVFARVQVMEDFGLATMSLSGMLLAVFVGVGMLGREISSKTIYTLMVRPIDRLQVLAGKFCGLLLTLFVNFSLMTLFFMIALNLIGGTMQPALLWAIALSWIEMVVIVAVALLFSCFTTPMLAAILTLGFYLIGHYNDFIDISYVQQGNPLLAALLKVIYFTLPNLEHFNIRTRVVYGLPVPPDYLGHAVLYGLCYTFFILCLAAWLFDRKDV